MNKPMVPGLTDREFELICVNRTLIYALYMMLKDNEERVIPTDRIDEKLDIEIKSNGKDKTITVKRKEQDMHPDKITQEDDVEVDGTKPSRDPQEALDELKEDLDIDEVLDEDNANTEAREELS